MNAASSPAGAIRAFCLAAALALGGCRSAYYSTMEAFGVYKRDLLVDRVEDGREAQEKAQEQFRTTLEAFQELTGAQGGELQVHYERLEREYERSVARAEAVSERIDAIERVAGDLFGEWKGEIGEIENPELAARSRALLEETRDRYEALLEQMRAAESRMPPVLTSFRDHVLFLKHSLNAQAVAALRTTAAGIETDVQALVDEMEQSIAAARRFVDEMKAN